MDKNFNPLKNYPLYGYVPIRVCVCVHRQYYMVVLFLQTIILQLWNATLVLVIIVSYNTMYTVVDL